MTLGQLFLADLVSDCLVQKPLTPRFGAYSQSNLAGIRIYFLHCVKIMLRLYEHCVKISKKSEELKVGEVVVDVLYGVIFLLIGLFSLLSGFNDGGNLMATFLRGGVLAPWVIFPILVGSIALGPLLFGTAVSRTIAVAIVNFDLTGPWVLAVAIGSAVLTLFITWRFRIPTSTTMALAGGMLGASIASGDARFIHWSGIVTVLVGLVASVILGFITAFVVTRALWTILAKASSSSYRRMKRLQYVSAMWQGMAYGANDQEKAIGLTALATMLWIKGFHYHVSWIAVSIPLVFWALGFWGGGVRIAKTVGGHIIRLDPMNALSTQMAAAVTVSMAAFWGIPVSTTQTTDGALFGTGTALNPLKVQWLVARNMLLVWSVTVPLSMVVGLVIMTLSRLT